MSSSKKHWILLRLTGEASYIRDIRRKWPHVRMSDDALNCVIVAAFPPGGAVDLSCADKVTGVANITHLLDDVPDDVPDDSPDDVVEADFRRPVLSGYDTGDGTVRYMVSKG